MYKSKQRGFTLIELSIVIVIIGFLVAGIAVGTNLIKQAQLRSVITDMQQYQTAYNNFISRFNSIPGDMPNASSFWPTASTTNPCADSDSLCNGNGNQLIEYSTTSDETAKAWRHLYLAGMISAGITKIPTGYNGDLTIGDRAPSGKLTGTGYFMGGAGNGSTASITIGTGVSSPWTDNRTNAVFIGRKATTTPNTLVASALTPGDAFNIDQKIDDGIIDSSGNFVGGNTGNIRVLNGSDNTTGCIDTNFKYVMSTTSAACVLGVALN